MKYAFSPHGPWDPKQGSLQYFRPEIRDAALEAAAPFSSDVARKTAIQDVINAAYREHQQALKNIERDQFLERVERFSTINPTHVEPEPQIAVDAEAERRKGRDEIITAMHTNGMSVRDIATATNLSRSVIGRIITAATN